MISVHFQGKPFSITVIQVYATTTHAEEAELDQFCWDLDDLLELTPQKRDRLLTPVFLGFPCGSPGKESSWNVRDLGSIPGWDNPLKKGKATHSSVLAWRIPWTV